MKNATRCALVLALALAAGPAFAGGETQKLSLGGSGIVRGASPLPEFHLGFLLDDPARQATVPPGSTGNLEIALTAPDNSVFRFLFSPRPEFGLSLDKTTGANRGYAGLTWNLFDSDTLFGNIGLAGTYDPGSGAPYDPLRRLGPPLMLHGAIELGYHLGGPHSLSLSLDQGRAPEFRLNAETTDNLRLRYGLKF